MKTTPPNVSSEPSKSSATNATDSDVPQPPTVEEFRDIEIHGLYSWYRADTIKERAFWTVVLLTFLVVLVYELVNTVKDYFENPILTTYSAIAKSSMEFPDVYICPTNFVNSSKLSKYQSTEWLKIYSSLGHTEFNQSTDYLSQVSSAWEEMAHLVREVDTKNLLHDFLKTDRPTIKSVEKFFMDVGYNLDQFLKECAFSGETLECKSITTEILDRNHGKCFLLRVHPKEQLTPGLGLRLVLDINTELYDSETWVVIDGVFVFVEQTYQPTVTKKVFIEPGTFSRVSLELTKMKFMNFKRGSIGQKCLEEDDTPPKMDIMNGTYTPTLCQMDCVQQTALKKCKCLLAVDSKFIKNDVTPPDDKELEFCDADKLKTCVYNDAFKAERNYIRSCSEKCVMMCHTSEYKLYVSSLNFPSQSMAFEPDYEKYKSDYILLDISFDEMHLVQVSQHKAVTFDTFVGNIGGQLGLWFGMSLLTIVQAFVLLIRYCRYKCGIYFIEKSKST